jgi:hypothetical protein
MPSLTCAICSKPIERGNYVHGVIVCAACMLEQAEDEQLPQRKNVQLDWREFTRAKRRKHLWR